MMINNENLYKGFQLWGNDYLVRLQQLYNAKITGISLIVARIRPDK